MKRTILATAALIILAACTPYEQRMANACTRMGAPPGSPDYWPCIHHVMDLDQQNRAMWAGVSAVGASSLSTPAPSQAYCSSMGNMSYCRGW
jgi:hypothetical protein